MMRATIFLALLLAQTCSDTDTSDAPAAERIPVAAFGAWTHSYEEDRGDIRVYRPFDYNFPPARHRTSFELGRDGTFVLYVPAPSDGRDAVHGHWEATGPNSLRAWFDDPKIATITMTIVSAERDRLELRSDRLRR